MLIGFTFHPARKRVRPPGFRPVFLDKAEFLTDVFVYVRLVIGFDRPMR